MSDMRRALLHVSATMVSEAIYRGIEEHESCDMDMDLLYDLSMAFRTFYFGENVTWTEKMVDNNDYWCELSIQYCPCDSGPSKITMSLDGKKGDHCVIGNVSIMADDKEVLNGIRYVEV